MIEAGGGRFRGIRYISASHPDQAAVGFTGHPAGRNAEAAEGARGLCQTGAARPQL